MAESEAEHTITGLEDESTQLSMNEDGDPADENTQDSSNGLFVYMKCSLILIILRRLKQKIQKLRK